MRRVPLRAMAVVFLAPLALGALAGGLAWQARQAQEAAAGQEALLARALSRPQAEPVLRGNALLVPGASAGLAAAAFQARVMQVAADAGAEVVQVENTAAEPAPPLARLGLGLHLRGTEAQIVASLAALESTRPLVVIDRIDLQGDGQDGGMISATLVLKAWSGELTP